jgi:hypothetical protein
VRYAPRAPAFGAPRRCAAFSACAGGSVNWAWTADKTGQPYWVDLSDEVGKWTDAADIDVLEPLAWTAPADAPMGSFPAQFVAAVLALGTNIARPSAALMSAAAFTHECRWDTWFDRKVKNLSDAPVLSRCVLKNSFQRAKDRAEALSARSVSDFYQLSKGNACHDRLGFSGGMGGSELGAVGSLPAFYEAPYMATLVDALPATGSCTVSCPFGRPLCNGTLGCVRPTCADFKPLCNNKTDAGMLARLLCSETCGCGDLASELLWIGRDNGCLPRCPWRVEEVAAMYKSASCSDAQPGSTELAALVEYSRAFEPQFADWHTSATVRAELGCFALNVDNRGSLCNHEFWNTTHGAKSLVPFCPVSCGCIENPSKPGCPRACRAPESPILRDLSDAQLAVATAARATWNARPDAFQKTPPFPPSCSGLNATVCDALFFFWYKHPCPVACGIDPDTASTSSAHH